MLIIDFLFIIWSLIFIVCLSLEIKQKEILFIYFSISSLLSCIISFFVKNIEIQIVIFLISSLIFVCFVKIIIDKLIEFNVKFTSNKKQNNDKFCIVLREYSKELKLYKVICKSGIYTARFIGDKNLPKFKICRIIHDDGKILLIQ